MPGSPERPVDEDASSSDAREEKIDDDVCEDGTVLHERPISYLPSALVAIASIPSAPPTEEPVSASKTIP